MARDYAPRGERRKAVRRKGGSTLPGWVWLFAGLSIGMAGAAFYYIGRPAAGAPPPAAAEPAAAPTRAAAARQKDALTLPPKEKPRFTFYELLPSQEVVIPREKLQPRNGSASAPAPAAAGEVYYIQVGSYRTEAEADRQKAALALIGAEARIEKVTIASGNRADTYYRVRIGPEKTVERAQALMQRLEDNGIESLLVRFRG